MVAGSFYNFSRRYFHLETMLLFGEVGRAFHRQCMHIEVDCASHVRCDHTSTNAPDPIRTPQLSVLGRE